jgi:S-adenosylmethionine hydrolase
MVARYSGVVRSITLLTDFGLQDHYVGVLHAVLEREAPGVHRLDLVHQVPPGDVWTASFLLRCSWQHLPDDCVVLAVVDPGVGGDRRPVAVRRDRRWLVGPDNGVVAAVGLPAEAISLDWRRMGLPEPSRTFHGRDLFAPAAARLARGDDPHALGKAVDPGSLVACPLPEPARIESGLRATVLHVDRFGNLVTNLSAGAVPDGVTAWYGAPRGARRVAAYVDALDGEVVVIAGSSGLLELAVNRESAAEVTGLGRGDIVDVTSGQSIGNEERRSKNEE